MTATTAQMESLALAFVAGEAADESAEQDLKDSIAARLRDGVPLVQLVSSSRPSRPFRPLRGAISQAG